MNKLQILPIDESFPIGLDDAQSLWFELHCKPRSLQDRRTGNITDRRKLGRNSHGGSDDCRGADRRSARARDRRAGDRSNGA